MHTTLIAEQLSNRLPLQIRTRLVEDEEFGARFGLRPRTVITVGDILAVDQREALGAARRALSGQEEQHLTDVKGAEIIVAADEDAVVLSCTEEGEVREFRLPELAILSSRPDKRMQVLGQLLDQLGPAAPDFSALRQAAKERELSDDEVGELLAECYDGVAALQARAAAAA